MRTGVPHQSIGDICKRGPVPSTNARDLQGGVGLSICPPDQVLHWVHIVVAAIQRIRRVGQRD
jgi:hypothetical protein